MPWSNQGGGPWRPNPGGPWGSGGSGNGQGGPNFEDMMGNLRERFGGFASGGGGLKWIPLVVLAAIALWALSGFYTVQPNEIGLNMIFGRYTGKMASGLNWNWPTPIGSVTKLRVTDRNTITVGFVSGNDQRGNGQSRIDRSEESLMLTGDDNIADVKFVVIWQIDPLKPEDFAFNVRNQGLTIKAVAESAMREVVGRTQIQRILTAERKVIEPAVQDLMQKVLDDYKSGVKIIQVQLQSVDPPEQVIAAFRDVTAAQQDQDRLRNEAEAYANRVVPEARGQAAQILQQAQAYKEQTVAEAKGQASRFSQVYEQYKKAPDVTRERLYLETMERVYGGMNKVVVDQTGGGQPVVPYLPLGALENPTKPAAPAQSSQQGGAR